MSNYKFPKVLLLFAMVLAVSLQTGASDSPPAPEIDLPELPEGLEWTTNYDDPLIGDAAALQGGTFRTYMVDYPLTFRLMGPNSNDSFSSWKRAFTMDFGLVNMHPVTDNYIPWVATHWAISEDGQTVYYHVHPEARWSDGEPITADDFQFTYEMMGSDFIVDPFYKAYRDTYFTSIEAVGDDVVKIVGTRPSWRPLWEYNIWPTPRHATKLDENWVKEATNEFPLSVGPYEITEAVPGERVVYEKLDDWWGTGEGYFPGLYNVGRIEVRVLPGDRILDYFKKREIHHMRMNRAKQWAEDLDFEAINKGWAHKRQVFVDTPQGVYGLHMNLEFPLFQNKDFRKAVQYLFDFETLNNNLMYNSYFRMTSSFEGTPFANPDLEGYPFNPRKAREHLKAAGFAKRGPDGILVNDQGERASFTLSYGSKTTEKHLTVLQQIYKRAGVEMELQLLDGATNFSQGLERKYEMTVTGRTARLYPDPEQYFHSKFVESTNNNNIWGFGSPETDELIETYKDSLDADERIAAMHKLDAIISDEAFYLPFWGAPFIRMIFWDDLQWPEFYLPKRTEQVTDWQVFWVDPDRATKLEAAMKAGTSLPGADAPVEVDPWDVQ